MLRMKMTERVREGALGAAKGLLTISLSKTVHGGCKMWLRREGGAKTSTFESIRCCQ